METWRELWPVLATNHGYCKRFIIWKRTVISVNKLDNGLERTDGIHTEQRDLHESSWLFSCTFFFKMKRQFLKLLEWSFVRWCLLSWKTKTRREMTQDEETWNSSGIYPRQRQHAGKRYRRLVHILTTNAKYVMMLRVWLKRSNSSSGAVRR